MGWTPHSVVARAVFGCGFEYDNTQDIIYSRADAPIQTRGGYNRGYDEAAAHMSMVIDCEPFYFTYGGKLWLIELWKGQYGLETGCEIGLYRDDFGGPPNAAFAKQRHYCSCKHRGDWLDMRLTLYRKGVPLLQRGPQPHWWLTGFKWGVFTGNTLDLTMDIEIKFKDKDMQDSFVAAAERTLYRPRLTSGYGVALTFDSPRTPQPASRKRWGEVKQANNLILVDRYNRYKAAHGYKDNNPNNFHELDGPAASAAQGARYVATKVTDGAAAAAKKFGVAQAAVNKLQHNVAVAGKHVADAVEDEADKVRECFSMFEKNMWHVTSGPA